MKKTNYNVTRFDIENCMHEGFYVEVTPNEKEGIFEFVLCQERYGLKSFMFGLMMKDAPEETWEDLIERNICDEIHFFLKEQEIWDSCDC